MRFDVSHRTSYRYTAPVSVSHMAMRLTPRSTPLQKVERAVVMVDPEPDDRDSSFDYFGNHTLEATLGRPHRALEVTAYSTVEVEKPFMRDLSLSTPWERAGVEALSRPEAQAFAFASPLTPANDAIAGYAAESFWPGRPIHEGAFELMRRIFADFAYDPSATDAHTTVERAFEIKRGVCQDYAHIMLAGLRSLCLPCRYVSGYLLTHPPEGQERLIGADASHAWVAVFDPADGAWVDFDPTNDLIPQDEHVTLAFGRDFGDVSPVKGAVYGGGSHRLAVAVDVNPL